jgi:pimeloyl-ACP methyl ester carboxylesterase
VNNKTKVRYVLEKTITVAGYKCRALFHIVEGTPIVFLHGLSYTIDIWQQTGITNLLIEKNVPFLALDMPYGLKSQCQPKTRDPEKNIEVINEGINTLFGSAMPIIVGTSIGGNMALRYASRFPVKGLLLFSPVRALEPNLIKDYGKFKFSTKIIWGSEDHIVPSEDMRTLADKIPKANLIVYAGATHSGYKDQPNRFKHDLLELYAKVE